MRISKLFSLEERGGFGSNLTYAIIAQGITLASSVFMSLIVPKLLGVEDYAYWQLFVLYSGYIGLALFGIHDGVFLRLGGARVTEISWSSIKAELLLVTGLQLLISAVVLLVTCFPFTGDSRQLVFLFVVVNGLLVNPPAFMFYVFRAANLPNIYSTASVLSGGMWVVGLIVLTAINPNGFGVYAVCYLACQAVSSIYCCLCAKKVLDCPSSGIQEAVRGVKKDFASGMKVTLAYYAGTLIVGSCRMLIDGKWGIEAFGKFSFSISLVNFLISFMAQVSMVLFPVVRRMNGGSQARVYRLIRSSLALVAPLIYLIYFPGCIALQWWVPQYSESLSFLAILLPVCYFDCKVQLLTNTYLKTLRKENALLVINLATLALSLALDLIAIGLLSNIVYAALAIVLSVTIRSVLAELYLKKFLPVGGIRLLLTEIMLAAGFIWSAYCAGSTVLVFLLVALFYLLNAPEFNTLIVLLRERFSVMH